TALMNRVRRRIGDKRILALVKAFLRAGILGEDTVQRDTLTGTPQGGILTPPTTWQNARLRARRKRGRRHPEDDLDLARLDLHALHRRRAELPAGQPVGRLQPLPYLRREGLELAHQQPQVVLYPQLVGEPPRLLLAVPQALPQPGDPGLELPFVDEPLGVAINQPGQPLAQLVHLRFHRGQLARLRHLLVPAPLVLRAEPLRLLQQAVHPPPDSVVQPV